MILTPSGRTRTRFPTISVGKTRSSKILSCTAVNVRDMGRGCFWRLLRPGLRMIRRCPINTTWRSENFFSSSRVNLHTLVSPNVPASEDFVPLLNFIEGGKKRDGDENHNSFLPTSNIDLTVNRYSSLCKADGKYFSGRVELEWSQLFLQIWNARFEIVQGLSDREFCLIRRANFGNLACCRHLLYVRDGVCKEIGEWRSTLGGWMDWWKVRWMVRGNLSKGDRDGGVVDFKIGNVTKWQMAAIWRFDWTRFEDMENVSLLGQCERIL